LVSIGVVGISNTLLCLIPGGKAVSAYKMATAGGSFVLKTFAVQFGKAVGLGVAAGYATDAGIEVARQLATGTKLSNLEYDRINEAGVTGAIAGGAGAIFGAGVEALANTRVGRSVVAKIGSRIDALKNTRVVRSAATRINGLVSRGKNAIRSGMDKLTEFSRQQFGWDTFSYVTPDGVTLKGWGFPDNGIRTAEVSDDIGKSGGLAYRSGSGSYSLLPGEGEIGTYRDLLDAGEVGDNITPHHMPSAEYMAQHGVGKKDGLCMNMEMPSPGTGGRHRLTDTYGRNMTDAEKAYYYSLSPRDALAYDIANMRQIYQSQGLYSEIRPKLQEYIKQYKELMPELFDK